MNQVNFDEETAEKLEVMYQRRDVLRRRELVRKALRPRPGERIIDTSGSHCVWPGAPPCLTTVSASGGAGGGRG